MITKYIWCTISKYIHLYTTDTYVYSLSWLTLQYVTIIAAISLKSYVSIMYRGCACDMCVNTRDVYVLFIFNSTIILMSFQQCEYTFCKEKASESNRSLGSTFFRPKVWWCHQNLLYNYLTSWSSIPIAQKYIAT